MIAAVSVGDGEQGSRNVVRGYVPIASRELVRKFGGVRSESSVVVNQRRELEEFREACRLPSDLDN